MREKRLITVADPDLEIRGGRGRSSRPCDKGGRGQSSRPCDKGGRGRSSRPWDKEGCRSQKIFFGPSGLSLVSNQGGPSPGSATRLVQKFGLRWLQKLDTIRWGLLLSPWISFKKVKVMKTAWSYKQLLVLNCTYCTSFFKRELCWCLICRW